MTLEWDNLEEPWQCCLEEAWAAYCMGSIPIGAAITDQRGRVVARGRNRIFEETAPGKLLCGHRLAHAEMNALIALEWDRADPRTLVLYTTTEPCAQRVGIVVSLVPGAADSVARDFVMSGMCTMLDITSPPNHRWKGR